MYKFKGEKNVERMSDEEVEYYFDDLIIHSKMGIGWVYSQRCCKYCSPPNWRPGSNRHLLGANNSKRKTLRSHRDGSRK